MSDDVVERLRAQVQRFRLDTGDDKSEVIVDEDGDIVITSACGGDVYIEHPQALATALEELPDDAAVLREDAPEGEWSVWDLILRHEI